MNLSLPTLSFRSLVVSVVLAAPALAQNLIEFRNGDPANAPDVNANFNALKTAVTTAQTAATGAATAAAAAQTTANAAATQASVTTLDTTVTNLGTSVTNLTSAIAIDANKRVCVGDNATGVGAFVPSLRIGRPSSNGNLDFLMRPDVGGFGWNMAVVDPATLGELRIASVNAAGAFTDRMVLGATGNVGIGTPSPQALLHVNGRLRAAPAAGGTNFVEINGFGDDTQVVHFSNNVLSAGMYMNGFTGTAQADLEFLTKRTVDTAALTRVKIDADGTVRNASGVWALLSDRRLKRNIQPIASEEALQTLLSLQGVTFEYTEEAQKNDLVRSGRRRGFIAQDVEEVLPDWVSTGDDGIKSVSEIGVTSLVVESLRALDSNNRRLQAENDALRERIASLEQVAQRLMTLEAAVQPLLAK